MLRVIFAFSMLAAIPHAAGEPGSFEVENRGMRGYSVGKVAAAWPKIKRESGSSAVTVLLVGTNDMINSEYLTPFDQFRNEYDKLLGSLAQSSTHLMVATLPPCVEEHLFRRHKRDLYGDASPNERIQQANKIIREIALQHGCKVVDLDLIFTEGTWEEGNPSGIMRTIASGGTPDGVHPNAAGAKRIGEAVAEAVKTIGLKEGKIICLGDSITYGGGLQGEGTIEGETYPAVLSQLLNGSPSNPNPDKSQ